MVDLLARGFGLQFLALDEPYVPTTTGFDSLSEYELGVLNKWFRDPINRKNLATHIFKGDERTVYRADYMLVYVGTPLLGWSGVWPIQNIIDLLCHPPVFECRKTVLNLGPITIQRKGGDSGKPTKFNLQFKFDPTQLQNTHPRPTFTREA